MKNVSENRKLRNIGKMLEELRDSVDEPNTISSDPEKWFEKDCNTVEKLLGAWATLPIAMKALKLAVTTLEKLESESSIAKAALEKDLFPSA